MRQWINLFENPINERMERWPISKGREVSVYRSPTRAMLEKLITEYEDVRGGVLSSGEFIIWPAARATHRTLLEPYDDLRFEDTFVFFPNLYDLKFSNDWSAGAVWTGENFVFITEYSTKILPVALTGCYHIGSFLGRDSDEKGLFMNWSYLEKMPKDERWLADNKELPDTED